ncbi:DUF551 domain-containing protein [Klebsiella pneumoniae]
MTKSTITRERVVALIAEHSYDSALVDALEHLLSAMDSEPVAIIDQANLDYLRSGADADVWPPEREEMGDVLLYRHPQPAPVVPDEKDKTVDADDHPLLWSFNEGWNACPSAMLAASTQSPGSEPATVPGKWIPVSEQMPEEGGDMIVFTDGIVMSGVSYAKKKGFYIQALEYDDDEPVDSVTHWMPLPADPQEVKP